MMTSVPCQPYKRCGSPVVVVKRGLVRQERCKRALNVRERRRVAGEVHDVDHRLPRREAGRSAGVWCCRSELEPTAPVKRAQLPQMLRASTKRRRKMPHNARLNALPQHLPVRQWRGERGERGRVHAQQRVWLGSTLRLTRGRPIGNALGGAEPARRGVVHREQLGECLRAHGRQSCNRQIRRLEGRRGCCYGGSGGAPYDHRRRCQANECHPSSAYYDPGTNNAEAEAEAGAARM